MNAAGGASNYSNNTPNASSAPGQGNNTNQLCCYPSKNCQNLRVVKRNGELHRLCEYHRIKANVNQRRLEQRRRMRNSQDAAMQADATRAIREEESGRYSLPDLLTGDAGLDASELQFMDEFLAQTEIELSPVNVGSHVFFDSNADMRMSI
ncbi:hypothetical protein PHYBOEH_008031 [Phytophthora boehmeriae]|uniref:Uncharacterized protein n=1 Tax=Phytophthora boehmeriae TaxID=109152 RepID=A0A8T1W261_9STRA|nr:hypothetical protein PHYBOEH_008031 [Phytophthora boehmeriae]